MSICTVVFFPSIFWIRPMSCLPEGRQTNKACRTLQCSVLYTHAVSARAQKNQGNVIGQIAAHPGHVDLLFLLGNIPLCLVDSLKSSQRIMGEGRTTIHEAVVLELPAFPHIAVPRLLCISTELVKDLVGVFIFL
ncbi:hypothetical protein B0O80DRAFT_241660 [Mortierella sp. GBAus27b]|nr:hypothetical protein B0O80DRAFT_241660 [Mortierella sp. GBAus27b]